LPAQPFTNPKDNVSAITLRSGKELEEPYMSKKEVESEKEVSEKLRLRNKMRVRKRREKNQRVGSIKR